MTDPLGALVARTLGVDGAVRPRAASRFERAAVGARTARPVDPGDEAGAHGVVQGTARGRRAAAGHAARPAPERATTGGRPAEPTSAPADLRNSEPEASERAKAAAEPPPVAFATERTERRAQPAAAPIVTPSPRPAVSDSARIGAAPKHPPPNLAPEGGGDTATPASEDDAPAPPPLDAGRDAAPPTSAAASPAGVPSPRPVPVPVRAEPLIPAADPERPRAMPSGAAPSGAEEPGTSGGVVHVHIGRIEVRAPARPEGPRAPKPREPLVSLDEYLEQTARSSR
jgi:hypothetical protein